MRLHLHLVVVSICSPTRAIHTFMTEDGERKIVGREEHTDFLDNEDISFFTTVLFECLVLRNCLFVLLDFVCEVGDDFSELEKVRSYVSSVGISGRRRLRHIHEPPFLVRE